MLFWPADEKADKLIDFRYTLLSAEWKTVLSRRILTTVEETSGKWSLGKVVFPKVELHFSCPSEVGFNWFKVQFKLTTKERVKKGVVRKSGPTEG